MSDEAYANRTLPACRSKTLRNTPVPLNSLHSSPPMSVSNSVSSYSASTLAVDTRLTLGHPQVEEAAVPEVSAIARSLVEKIELTFTSQTVTEVTLRMSSTNVFQRRQPVTPTRFSAAASARTKTDTLASPASPSKSRTSEIELVPSTWLGAPSRASAGDPDGSASTSRPISSLVVVALLSTARRSTTRALRTVPPSPTPTRSPATSVDARSSPAEEVIYFPPTARNAFPSKTPCWNLQLRLGTGFKYRQSAKAVSQRGGRGGRRRSSMGQSLPVHDTSFDTKGFRGFNRIEYNIRLAMHGHFFTSSSSLSCVTLAAMHAGRDTPSSLVVQLSQLIVIPVTRLLGWRDTCLLADDDAVHPEHGNGGLCSQLDCPVFRRIAVEDAQLL